MFAPLTAQLTGTLLDTGNNATVDWNPATIDPVVLSQMPVSDSNWIIKGVKTLYLSKNDGAINAGTGTVGSPSGGTFPSTASCRMYWKRPGVTRYETSTGAPNPILPTDYALCTPRLHGRRTGPTWCPSTRWSSCRRGRTCGTRTRKRCVK